MPRAGRAADPAERSRPWAAAVDRLRSRDAGFAALRRAGRTALVMPALFALGTQVIGNPVIATFAAFGSFAMLLFVDFAGPVRGRIAARVGLAAVGAVFICLGTLAGQHVWTAALAMAVVGFAVLFAGIVSSVLAAASTALLLSFILAVALPGPVSSLPDRLAGWGLAAAAAILAGTLLWPAPVRDPLRARSAEACRALAERLRAGIRAATGDAAPGDATTGDPAADHPAAVERARAAVAALRSGFYATPYRPTGLSTEARAVVRLVDELGWLAAILDAGPSTPASEPSGSAACAVKAAAAQVLDEAAGVLAGTDADPERVRTSTEHLRATLAALQETATATLPVPPAPRATGDPAAARPATATADPAAARPATATADPAAAFVTALEPGFRAQELGYATTVIADNVLRAARAERRTWWQRLLGQQPDGLPGALASARQRAGAHLERHSVWLHNSVRGAVGLGLAVAIADVTGVQHSFWVVLGTLSVLRSNALSTGQNVVRGLLGTVLGFLVGGLLVAAIGTNTTVLWLLLAPAVLLAGLAPAVISFAAGQAAFTGTLLILFNIISPAGWSVGLVRIEDVAIGCAISLLVGALFWPRGAGSALGTALAEAYRDSAHYLRTSVDFGVLRCDPRIPSGPPPVGEAGRAAAAARRLDDAFRNFLAERGTKSLPLAEVTTLVTGVAGLRAAADAVVALWDCETPALDGDRAAVRAELLSAATDVWSWYDQLGRALVEHGPVPAPQEHDAARHGPLAAAVRRDLGAPDGSGTPTAVRVIWTADHLDAARRLEFLVAGPARETAAQLARPLVLRGPLRPSRPRPALDPAG